MKTKILKTFITISLIFGFIYGAGKITALTISKRSLQSYLSKQIGADIVIKGKIDFKILPSPHLEISHLRINDVKRNIASLSIRAPKAKIYPDLLSLIKFELVAKNVEFVNSELNIELVGLDSSQKFDHNDLSEKIIFTDSSLLITNEKYKLEKRFKNLSLAITQKNKNYNINGSFSSNLNNYLINSSFKLNQENKIDINANLKSDSNILKFEGFFDKEKLQFSGDSKVSGSSLQKFLFKYVNRSSLFFPDGNNFDFKLDFDLTLDEGGVRSDEIIISSPSLNSKAQFYLNSDGMGGMNFDIIDVELGEIISDEDKIRISQELIKLGPDDQIFFQVPESGIFEVSVNAQSLNLYQHELSDVIAKLSFDGLKQSKDYKIDFTHSQSNKFNIVGNIILDEDNNIGLSGDISSNGENFEKLLNTFDFNINIADKEYLKKYTLSNKFNLADKLISLSDINLKFDDTNMSGLININNSLDNKSSEISLDFDKINFDNYKMIDFAGENRTVFSYLFGKISEVSDRRTLFQKFLWLRNINSLIKYKFNFDEFSANNFIDKNLSISGKLDHRYFSIDTFNIASKKNNFSTKLIVDINDINPRIDVSIYGMLLNANFLGNQDDNSRWSEAYLRIPDFTDLPGAITIDINNFHYEHLKLQDILVSTSILDNVLYFDTFKGKIYNTGKFNIAGNFIVGDVPTLNIAFTAENLKLHKLGYQIFNQDNYRTIANLSGKLNCFGQNTYMFFNTMKADIRMITKPITINNYNIKNVVQYIADISNYEENLPKYNLKELLKNGDITVSPIDLKLKINKGSFKIDNLSLHINDAKSIYSGIVNLPEQQLALNNVNVFRSYYRSGDDLKEQMLRFDRKYTGNLFAPEYVLEDSQISNFVSVLTQHSDSVIKRRDLLRKEQEEQQRLLDEQFKKMQDEEAARLKELEEQRQLEAEELGEEEEEEYNDYY